MNLRAIRFIAIAIALSEICINDANAHGCSGSQFTLNYSSICGCYQFCGGPGGSLLISDCDSLVSLSVDWGDGSGNGIPVINGFPDTNSMPCHQYSSPGTYTVTLTVVGFCHSIFSAQTCHIPRTLFVAPFSSNFTADFKADTVCLGFVTPFFDLSTFNPDLINRTWLYDFGDGATATVYNPVHLYDSCGAYDVTLIIGGENLCCPLTMYDTITRRVYVNCNQGSQPNALGLTDPYIYDSTLADICCGGRVSGRIVTESGQPVSIATVSAMPSGQFDITDSSGNYSLSFFCGSSDTVAPSKNNDVLVSNGVSTADVLLIRAHILNSQMLSTPYKIIAADVNGSGSISTADVLLIRQLILGNRTTFPNGSLWTFVPHNYVFADPLSPFPFPTYRYYNNIASDISGENYIGIRLGDVNGSWNPTIH